MKYHWKHILAFAAIAVMGALTSTAHADVLGYWPFEDAPGKVVEDVSGEDNHGEASDNFAFSPDGKIGQAGDFGDFNNQAFVSIAAAADGAFNSIVDSQQATIAFHMNRQGKDSNSQWTWIFDGGSDSSDPVTGRQLASHAGWGGGNGTLYFDTGGCCGGNQRINKEMLSAVDALDFPAGTAFGQDGEWHHYAYVRDKQTTFVYIDGELFHESAADAITSPVAAITQATIGANAGGGNSTAGLIDDFAIFDEAVDLERIQAWAAGAPVIGGDGPDFNEDGAVNIDDFNIMVANFGLKFPFGESGSKGDYNGDLRVNLKDFFAFRADFQAAAGAGAGAAAVPEPTSFVLIGMMLVGLLTARRRRC